MPSVSSLSFYHDTFLVEDEHSWCKIECRTYFSSQTFHIIDVDTKGDKMLL